MKRKFSYFCVASLIAVSVISFNGCTMENDYPELSDDLRIESQISMMNMTTPDGGLLNNPYAYIPVLENECMLYAFTLLHSDTWSDVNTASQYYYSLRNDAISNYGYNGGAMLLSTALELGKKHGIVNGELSFGVLNDSISAQQYFETETISNIKTVTFNQNGVNHTAVVTGYSKNSGTIYYKDKEGKGQINVSEVVSVFYK